MSMTQFLVDKHLVRDAKIARHVLVAFMLTCFLSAILIVIYALYGNMIFKARDGLFPNTLAALKVYAQNNDNAKNK